MRSWWEKLRGEQDELKSEVVRSTGDSARNLAVEEEKIASDHVLCIYLVANI